MIKKNMLTTWRFLLPLCVLSVATVALAQAPVIDSAKPVSDVVVPAPTFHRSTTVAPIRPEPSEAIKALEAKAKVQAETRWTATVNKDYEAVYQMLSPSSQRSVVKGDYIAALASRPVLQANVFSVACTAEECTTTAYTTTKMHIPRVPSSGVLTTTEDRWIVSDGKLALIVR